MSARRDAMHARDGRQTPNGGARTSGGEAIAPSSVHVQNRNLSRARRPAENPPRGARRRRKEESAFLEFTDCPLDLALDVIDLLLELPHAGRRLLCSSPSFQCRVTLTPRTTRRVYSRRSSSRSCLSQPSPPHPPCPPSPSASKTSPAPRRRPGRSPRTTTTSSSSRQSVQLLLR